MEQLANVGSDVHRALNWQEKGRPGYSLRAVRRALELLHLTIEDPKNRDRTRELTQIQELLTDYFYGENLCHSTPALLRGYFDVFARAARRV